MKRLMVLAASAALVFGFGVSMNAQAKKGQPKAAAGSPETVVYDAASAMAFLATTNGDWVAGAAGGQHEHGAPTSGRSVVTVKTKAAGSAVVHQYAQGTPGEMETVFHMDGDQLLLTHYCALQNAPVLKFVKTNKPGEIKFEFQGGTNFDPSIDAHLHASTFIVKDANTIEQNSTVYAGGKVNQELSTLLHRRASSN